MGQMCYGYLYAIEITPEKEPMINIDIQRYNIVLWIGQNIK